MFFLITELCLLVDIDFDDPEENVEWRKWGEMKSKWAPPRTSCLILSRTPRGGAKSTYIQSQVPCVIIHAWLIGSLVLSSHSFSFVPKNSATYTKWSNQKGSPWWQNTGSSRKQTEEQSVFATSISEFCMSRWIISPYPRPSPGFVWIWQLYSIWSIHPSIPPSLIQSSSDIRSIWPEAGCPIMVRW